MGGLYSVVQRGKLQKRGQDILHLNKDVPDIKMLLKHLQKSSFI